MSENKQIKEQQELLHCPFCGSDKFAWDNTSTRVYPREYSYNIRCLKCHAQSGRSKDKQKVIDRWNTRIGSFN
jgi:Lar family restriction alleviation protein